MEKVLKDSKMDKKDVANLIDHTLLLPEATSYDIKKLCKEAKKYGFKSVCVNSFWVKKAVNFLANSEVSVCSVIGFPLGAMSTEAKIFEAVQAVQDGASEIDMVANIGAVKSGLWKKVSNDIYSVIQAVKKNNNKVIVKVIFETCLLNENEKIELAHICKIAGADFTKTSTGFSIGGATVEDVKLLAKEGTIAVKASGGVRTLKTLLSMVESGASRIGTSNGVAIMKEFDGIANKKNEGY